MAATEASRVEETAAYIRGRWDAGLDAVVIAGTGLAHLAEAVKGGVAIDYADIPHFPPAKVKGHAGELAIGEAGGKKIAVLNGRFHLYEGWTGADVARPVRALARLGARTLVVTNCAGSLNPDFETPCAMLITDQINFTGKDPLTGPHEPELGERFVDMSNCYDRQLLELARERKGMLDLPLHEGIYAGFHGPMFETSAERRMLRLLGGDAVGMSTVLEVIAAREAGMRVLGFSALANMATGGPDQQPDSHEAILAATYPIAKELGRLIEDLLPHL
ncbi:MAG: purine-nucleoside phosphorylase [Betaproteobacteria bacterium AqS2]|uniref:Purine nucleoside phosphorylase n=1 Tax=Candidatus Amphirhobacter heronislandensis TaxID=1732024 RepID=A0A930UAV1_9GAMM|nr:purine-nucleoside phosphorylase [Betaproteobacteria bacterium AqS2]